MPKNFPPPTKHLFGSLLLLATQMQMAKAICYATTFIFGKEGVLMFGFMYVRVYTHHAKIPQPDESQLPGISQHSSVQEVSYPSHIAGTLFPLWKRFKTLRNTTVTSQWRACESGDQLVFFLLLLSKCLTLVFFIHTPAVNAILRPLVW